MELKDWRGTPIEVGCRVLFAGGRDTYKSFAIGIVTELEVGKWRGTVWCDWLEHSSAENKKSRALDSNNLTVITKDMLDV